MSSNPARPLGWSAWWLAAGALLGLLLGPHHALLPVLALGVGSSLAVVGLRIGLRPRAWVGPALAILAFLATSPTQPAPSAHASQGETEVCGRVLELRDRTLVLETDLAAADRVLVDGVADEGDTVCVRAALVPLAAFRNESPHPDFVPAQRTARARDAVLVSREIAAGPRRWLERARRHVRRSVRASLDDDVEGLVLALVLGDAAIAPEDAADARAAGLSHVIAVSGMHVTLVVGAIVLALAALARRIAWIARRTEPRALAWTLGALLAPLYAAFAGGSPSAWRAAATASVTWLLAANGRRPDARTVTAVVVVLACMTTPRAAQSPAFVLSVVATAAVLEPLDVELDAPFALARTLLRGAVRASLATAPITLWCFGTLAPLSIVANLVVVPVVAAILLPLGTMHALVASCSVELASVTAAPTERVARAFVSLAEVFAHAGPARPPPPLDAAELVLVAVGALGTLGARTVPRAMTVLAVTALLVVGAELHLRHRESGSDALRVTFLDVAQGDAALIDLPDGQLWLLDMGGASFGARRDPGREAILPLLRARRRDRVDLAIVSHPHPDHQGGFAGVASAVPIHALWDSGQASEEAPDGTWARRLGGLLVPLETPETLCGAPRVHAGVRVEVLAPCPRFDPGFDANDNSMVLRVRFGRRTFLLLGDAERHEEARILPQLGAVDVVKVGHHGSRTSSTRALVERTRPWLAVISAGVGNRYGHPHAEVLERWRAAGAHVARTDEDGSVTVWTDGDRLEASTWSGRRLEAPRGREALDAAAQRAAYVQ